MYLARTGIETKACIIPYEKSSLAVEGYDGYHQSTGRTVLVGSVKNDDNLVTISLPGGSSVVVNASEMIKAIQKCVL